MKLSEFPDEIAKADAHNLRVLCLALLEHIQQMRKSGKIIGLEADILQDEEVRVIDRSIWPGDW